eukprot:gnl/TRDRNA2_/TRDRNA2_188919_c0_seq1.p1 gnl/TRDRNA2_/TRDRNA2_188919_c0~~gnl/TRDRNA2_/TRDRNA2_188919_c0_seq1.p1  ORF type:complete len:438 (-),score=77.82 gnl/TRDRNA2_/TRDRNA2_188919_c0_seq1:31-1293(-)
MTDAPSSGRGNADVSKGQEEHETLEVAIGRHVRDGGGAYALAAALLWLLTRRRRLPTGGADGGTWSSVVVCFLFVQAGYQMLKTEVVSFLEHLAAKSANNFDDRLVELLKKELQSRWAWIAVTFAGLRLGPSPPNTWLHRNTASLFTLRSFAEAAIACMCAWQSKRLVASSLGAVVEELEDPHRRQAAKPFVRCAEVATSIAALLFIGHSVGINVRAGVGALGIGGVGIAFGVQNFVQDFMGAASMLLISQQFTVGDDICVDGKWGTVEGIGLKCTLVRDWDGDLHAVPNGAIASSTVTNGKSWKWRRGHVNIELCADTTAAQLKAFPALAQKAIESTQAPELSGPTRSIEWAGCYMSITEWGFAWASRFMLKDESGTVSSTDIANVETACRISVVEALQIQGYTLASQARLAALSEKRH